MGRLRFDRPYGTEMGARHALLPSDKSLGYYQTTLRVEIRALRVEIRALRVEICAADAS